MDEIEIRNSGDCIICLNGDLNKTYPNLNDALLDAKAEKGDIIIVFGGTDNNGVESDA